MVLRTTVTVGFENCVLHATIDINSKIVHSFWKQMLLGYNLALHTTPN